MRKAIFLGGPCDGKALYVGATDHPSIHLAVPHEGVDWVFDPVKEPVAPKSYLTARYNRCPTLLPDGLQTSCVFYTFEGTDR